MLTHSISISHKSVVNMLSHVVPVMCVVLLPPLSQTYPTISPDMTLTMMLPLKTHSHSPARWQWFTSSEQKWSLSEYHATPCAAIPIRFSYLGRWRFYRCFQYSLNSVNQARRLFENSSRPAIDIRYSNHQTILGCQHPTNVSIDCNSGVYLSAAKLALEATLVWAELRIDMNTMIA